MEFCAQLADFPKALLSLLEGGGGEGIEVYTDLVTEDTLALGYFSLLLIMSRPDLDLTMLGPCMGQTIILPHYVIVLISYYLHTNLHEKE